MVTKSMPSGRYKRIGVFTLVVLIVITLAYIIGVNAAQFVTQSSLFQKDQISQAQATQEVLEKMNTLAVGDTLPSFFLNNLDGETVSLERAISSKCIISFFKANCDFCFTELEMMQSLLKTETNRKYFLMVSSSNPFQLSEIKEAYNINFSILYDHEKVYNQHLKIATYPFNIFVDDNLVIKKILVGAISESEVFDFLGHDLN